MRITPELRPARDAADTLVVIMHGLQQRVLKTVPGVVADRLPSADILMPTYEAGPFSNADPLLLASDVSDLIERQWQRHREATGAAYHRIVLIGHSRGALLIRKAYVFARGETGELELGGLLPAAKEWHRAVERIILLAGLNRGWSLHPKPPRAPYFRWLLARLAAFIAQLTGTATLLRGIQRGAPFVANLRVQWIRSSRAGAMPLTVQILGDMDDVVAPGDNIDLQAGQDFVYLNAPAGTTHASVVELDDPARREVFLRALVGTSLKSEYTVPPEQRQDDEVQRVVFVMHGIRDFGGWTGRLSEALKTRAARGGVRVATVTSSYGYFPMIRFLLFSERQKNVRWFMDQYTEVLARYRNAEAIDFVGHSNGTYLVGSALRKYRSCTFGRVVCAGSVLPRDFEWNEMVRTGRIGGIRSYIASRDWVVGVFPNLFDRWGDIGGGGFLGFVREPAVSSQFLCVDGGHGAAVADDNFESIESFVLDGALVPPPEKIRAPRSALVELASKLDWAIWALLAASIVVALWYVASVSLLFFGFAGWLPVAFVLLLLVGLLNTV